MISAVKNNPALKERDYFLTMLFSNRLCVIHLTKNEDMKKSVVIVILCLFASASFAQSNKTVKLYAFKQHNLPGKKSTNAQSKETYRLYVTHPSKQMLTVTGVWIKSNYYRFETLAVSQKPVVHNSGFKKDTLVPFTRNRITEITKLKLQQPAPRPANALGKLLSVNEVVVSYMLNGKEYFAVAKTLKVLEPFATL